MFLCYIDESGTSAIPGNTTHFVLTGLAIPIHKWKQYESQINRIKAKYGLNAAEIHTGWILRRYSEESKIDAFNDLSYVERRSAVTKLRNAEMLRLQKIPNGSKQYKQIRKNYEHTEPYIHLSFEERNRLVEDLADCVSSWTSARLFAECVNKLHFDPIKSKKTVDEQAFEQIVSRFEQCLKRMDGYKNNVGTNYGLLIHDNNPTVSLRHTELMKRFHRQGTLFTSITNIIETPLFVDSQLTGMIQIADVCALAIRVYLEKGYTNLFDRIFCRADKIGRRVVGIRHFTETTCNCRICKSHHGN